jgi:uncharacterized protein YndB with AHSA1/START domain
VLESARLIERTVEGRVHRFRLRRKPLQEAGDWIVRHQRFWTGAVDQLEIRRRLGAPCAKVFAAFVDPALVERWLRPSPEIGMRVLHYDFRAGGAYRFAYDVAPEQVVFIGGTFREISPPHRIVFSWLIEPPDEHAGIESQVTVALTPSGGATELVIHHDNFGRADAEARHAQGWQGALDHLSAFLAEDDR